MNSTSGSLLGGAAWTIAGRGLQLAAHVGGLLVLARYLDKEQFGLAAMVTVVTGFVMAGADLGMGVVNVQRREVDDHRAAGLAQNAGFLLMLLVMVGAPLIARAFDRPDGYVPLLRAGAVSLMMAGFAAPARARLARDLSFPRLAGADASVALLAATGRIGFAMHGYGAWSIVLGDLVAAALGAALLWLLAPEMRPGRDRRLLADGTRVVGTRAADACFQQADRFLVGNRLGAGNLGLYGFAMQHAMVLVQHLTPVAEQVALPILSRLQNDRTRLHATYLRLTRLFALAVVPFSALLWAIAPWLIDALYPARWQEAVPALRALCVASACAGLNSHPGLVWLALGRMRLRLQWSLANLLALVGVLLVGVEHGAVGVAYALAARSLLAAAVAQALTRRIAGVAHLAYARALLPGLLAGAAVALVRLLLPPLELG